MRRTCSNRKSNCTPMKMLIAQEMSKELETNCSPPNVVAKLMGLESLPKQKSNSASYCEDCPSSHSDVTRGCWEQHDEFFQYAEPNEYKDIYEIQEHSQKANCLRDTSLHQCRYDETMDRKMAVRQKFNEAKRLSTDKKLRQSKQFQDTLEFLNSNKDLLLDCMQETTPACPPCRNHLPPVPPGTKRITILKPSNMVSYNHFAGEENVNQIHVKGVSVELLNGSEKCHLGCFPTADWKTNQSPTQTTRIIVLKPSPLNLHNVKSMRVSHSESPRMASEGFFGDVKDTKDQESREIAKAITQQMRKKLSKHRRDETLLSSVFSNGYVSDASSFNKSEIEYAAGDISDSEVTSPVFRHSQDCVNRHSSPDSSSSRHASYSPDSSVCREAKKRLSERWAQMASNGNCLRQKHVQRSSSTLGEMLALAETKKTRMPEEEGSFIEEHGDSNSHFGGDQRKDENVDHLPRNLLRAKSLPASVNESGARFTVVTPASDGGDRPEVHDNTKTRSVKSSIKGTVASLFFSKNKKSGKDKSRSSVCQEECCSSGRRPAQIANNKSRSHSPEMFNSSSHWQRPSSMTSSPYQVGKQGISSPEVGLDVTRSSAAGKLTENHDQPSPISVLVPFFQDEEHTTPDSAGQINLDRHGLEFPVHHVKSSLIDKSPAIGSVARTLSWDDLCVDTASSYHSSSLPTTALEEDGQWVFLVQTLLTAAGFVGEGQSDSFLSRWHSSESPLDPSLRESYIHFQDKEIVHEAKQRQNRSTRKLVFDCVNAALMDIARYGSNTCQGANASPTMVDQVWAQINRWISDNFMGDCWDDDSFLVERVVRKEVVGKGWHDGLRLEMDNLGKEIERKLLEDLVLETLKELTDGIK